MTSEAREIEQKALSLSTLERESLANHWFFAIFSSIKQFSPFLFLTLDRLEGTAMRRVLCGRAGF
jgi:hypothetical protein